MPIVLILPNFLAFLPRKKNKEFSFDRDELCSHYFVLSKIRSYKQRLTLSSDKDLVLRFLSPSIYASVR